MQYKDQGFGITVVGKFGPDGSVQTGAIVFQSVPRVGVSLKIASQNWGAIAEVPDLFPALASLTASMVTEGNDRPVTQGDVHGMLEELGISKWEKPEPPKEQGY